LRFINVGAQEKKAIIVLQLMNEQVSCPSFLTEKTVMYIFKQLILLAHVYEKNLKTARKTAKQLAMTDVPA